MAGINLGNQILSLMNGLGNASARVSPFGMIAGGISDLGNLALGIGQNIWQGFLNNQQMQREDNALQRKMIDAQLAGINPLTAVTGVTGASASAGTVGTTAQIGNSFGQALNDYQQQKLARMQYNNSVQELKLKHLQLVHSVKQWEDTSYKRTAEANQYELNAKGTVYAGKGGVTDNPNTLEKMIIQKLSGNFDDFVGAFKNFTDGWTKRRLISEALADDDPVQASNVAKNVIQDSGYTTKTLLPQGDGVGASVEIYKDGKLVKTFSNFNEEYALIEAGEWINKHSK